MTDVLAEACPKCGEPMEVAPQAALSWQTAPWLCSGCRRGFWMAECTDEARAIYRPHLDDWGFQATWLRGAVDKERAESERRGTSIHPDLEPLLDDETRSLLAQRRA